MNLEKHIRVLSLGIAMVIMLVGFSCQRSPLAPDEEMVKHLQTLSDSSSLKKQNSQANYEQTADSLDAPHSLEESSSDGIDSIPPILIFAVAALIILGIASLLIFFVVKFVIKRVKSKVDDMGYQINNVKDKLEDTLAQKTPENMNAEEKESIDTLLNLLNKFGKK